MKLIRLGAAALNQTPLDWAGNLRRCREAVAEAKSAGVGLLLLPELALSGYGCEDAFLMPAVQEAAWKSLKALVKTTRGIAVAVGLPVFHGGAVFNVAALLADGRLAGLVPKRHLAGDGLHYEPRWFKPWPAGALENHEAVPMGDILFDLSGVGVGFEICEDAWVPERPGISLARRGVDVILNPSASHFAFGKQETRRRFVAEGSRAFGTAYAYANLLGNEAGRVVYDGALLVATEGRVVAEGPRFAFAERTLTWADVDVDVNRVLRARSASFRPELESDSSFLVSYAWPELKPATAPGPAAWEESGRLKEEEFTRAVTLGLHDYRRKSGSSGFVVSLSGGADSSATSALAHLAVTWGGGGTLTTVFQGTQNSSAQARASARAVARALGSEHVEWEVDALVSAYEALAAKALGRPLTWEHDDIARQNIQARVRAPGVWAVANAKNALLLATSDRSEAAVGYATMDGDTAGGVSPIAGIDKAFLLRWLAWMGAQGPLGSRAIPALGAAGRLTPSPELRPHKERQTSEGDLMPYAVLDAIERSFVRDKRSPPETLRMLTPLFPDVPKERLRAWVEKFYRLWCRSQWKRERYAPSFHLDDESLDPRGWCRFPILSGGFSQP